MFFIADQTINEALSRGARGADIAAMLALLRKYPLDAVDITLSSWEWMPLAISESLKELLRCKTEPSTKEIQKVIDYGFRRVLISCKHQADKNFDELKCVLRKAALHGLQTSIGIEADRYSAKEFDCYQELIAEFGVERLIYKDSSGKRDAQQTFQELNALQTPELSVLEYHGQNHYGLATGNSLGALRAGTRYIATAVGGVGNHAAMEEVLMVVSELWKQGRRSAWPTLADDCARILGGMGITIPPTKAIIGEAIFEHESGIHVDGISKNPSLYEAFNPEHVGLTRKTVIGKHSGTASLKQKFQEWGVTLNREAAENILERVRELSIKQKGALSEEQLRKLIF